jgi:hypothetical protein
VLDIRRSRLASQRLSGQHFQKPEDVVSWLGAVQAQEYADAKWALALRMGGASDAVIERAFAAGRILRTHVMRPTWHFVAPADIRWMLALTAPHVTRRMAPYNRRLELDAAIFRRSQKTFAQALEGGVELTRQELKAVLERAGIRAVGVQQLAHIVMQAELDAVICSGARRGKQFTYALLDEKVPNSRTLPGDAALGELARRYFTSHGPAQLQDFAWWSGLKAADARHAIASAERHLTRDLIDGRTYWFASSIQPRTPPGTAYLLGLYDEYLIAYKDRSAALDAGRWTRVPFRHPFIAPIVVNGQVVGGWRRSLRNGKRLITLALFEPVGRRSRAAVEAAARQYSDFAGFDHDLAWD